MEEQYLREMNEANAQREELRRQRKLQIQPGSGSQQPQPGSTKAGAPPTHLMHLMAVSQPQLPSVPGGGDRQQLNSQSLPNSHLNPPMQQMLPNPSLSSMHHPTGSDSHASFGAPSIGASVGASRSCLTHPSSAPPRRGGSPTPGQMPMLQQSSSIDRPSSSPHQHRHMRLNQSHQRGVLTFDHVTSSLTHHGGVSQRHNASSAATRSALTRAGSARPPSQTALPGGGGAVAPAAELFNAAARRRGGMPLSAGTFVIADEKKSKTIQDEKREASSRRLEDWALAQTGSQFAHGYLYKGAPIRPLDPRHYHDVSAHYLAKQLGGTNHGAVAAGTVLTSPEPVRGPGSRVYGGVHASRRGIIRPTSSPPRTVSPTRLPTAGLVPRPPGPPGYTLGFPSQHTSQPYEPDEPLVFKRKTVSGVSGHSWREPMPDTTPRGSMAYVATGLPPKPAYATTQRFTKLEERRQQK